jgi:hypothetical protein
MIVSLQYLVKNLGTGQQAESRSSGRAKQNYKFKVKHKQEAEQSRIKAQISQYTTNKRQTGIFSIQTQCANRVVKKT